MRVYLCMVCGFEYSEADGLPDKGIAPGTKWENVPEEWRCPDCGSDKDSFSMVEYKP